MVGRRISTFFKDFADQNNKLLWSDNAVLQTSNKTCQNKIKKVGNLCEN